MSTRELSVVIALLFVIGTAVLSLRLLGPVPAIVFTVAFGGGLVLWLATTYRTPTNPAAIIQPYLATVLLFVVHVYEEYLTDFEVALADITGVHVLERDFLSIAAFLAPVIWLAGALMVLRRWHLGYYFMSAFFVAMIIAELAHFVFPFLEDGTFHYVSGMYTAALPLIPATYGLMITLREIRGRKTDWSGKKKWSG